MVSVKTFVGLLQNGICASNCRIQFALVGFKSVTHQKIGSEAQVSKIHESGMASRMRLT